MLLILVIGFLVIALIMFVQKVVMKNIMQKRLGRKVEDRELTSLTSWMAATPDPPQRNQGGPQTPPDNRV